MPSRVLGLLAGHSAKVPYSLKGAKLGRLIPLPITLSECLSCCFESRGKALARVRWTFWPVGPIFSVQTFLGHGDADNDQRGRLTAWEKSGHG